VEKGRSGEVEKGEVKKGEEENLASDFRPLTSDI